MRRLQPTFFDASGATLEELAEFGEHLIEYQQSINFWIGDIARYAEAIAKKGYDWHQVFPPCSPGLIDRCKAVAKAYPNREDRKHPATWTQYMQNASKPDRQERLAAIIEAGQTSDESKQAPAEPPSARSRWLLVVDVHYHLHRHWFSGAGVEAAQRVADWIGRTVERLKENGLTDLVCAMDSPNNFRKHLTKGPGWEEQRYKDRPPKDPELVNQLHLVRDLLEKAGFLCVTVDGFEADDVIASYAETFAWNVTILGQDKDLKQLLSGTVNMLLDIEWTEDPTSGDMLPDYKWYTAAPTKKLTELRDLLSKVVANEEDLAKIATDLKLPEDTTGDLKLKVIDLINTCISLEPKNLLDDSGLRPEQWAEFQAIMGDNTDGIKGAEGIGQKGAADLMKEFGTLDVVIDAAKVEDERIKPKKREALIRLGKHLDVVKQLVTLRRDLPVPSNTRLT